MTLRIYGMRVLPLRLVDLSLLGCASAADILKSERDTDC